MKKTLLFLACTLLLALTMTATVGAYAFVPGSDAVVYVDGTAGSDANNGATPAAAVATPQKAQSLLPNGGTVVVSGETALTAAYNPAAVNGAVLYTSVYGGTDYRKSGAKLSVGGNMTFSNDTYFDNIDLAITKSTLIFSGKFHNFGFGAGFSLNVVRLDASYMLATAQTSPLDQTLRFTLTFDMDGLKDIFGKRK